MLLVYGGDELQYADALSDAHATGAKDVVAVLNAFDEGDHHPLLAKANRLFAASGPALEVLAEERRAEAAQKAEPEATAVDANAAPDWKALADAAESRALAAEARAEAAETRAAGLEAALAKNTVTQRPIPSLDKLSV